MLLKREESYIVKVGEWYLNEVSEDDYNITSYLSQAFKFDNLARACAAAKLITTFVNKDKDLQSAMVVRVTIEYTEVGGIDEQS